MEKEELILQRSIGETLGYFRHRCSKLENRIHQLEIENSKLKKEFEQSKKKFLENEKQNLNVKLMDRNIRIMEHEYDEMKKQILEIINKEPFRLKAQMRQSILEIKRIVS